MHEATAASGKWSVEEPGGIGWRRIRVVLVRHGESVWNAAGIIQGQAGPGLTARGKVQAETTARALRAAFPGADLVVRSDLERVVETAAPLVDGGGFKVLVDERLREIDTGTWSGRAAAEVAEAYPDVFAAIRRGEDVRRGGGETFADLRRRVAAALTGIADHEPTGGRDTTVLVFTHGGPIRVAVAEALDLPPGGHQRITSPANCSITVLEQVVDVAGVLRSTSLSAYNRVGHLASVPVQPFTDDPGQPDPAAPPMTAGSSAG